MTVFPVLRSQRPGLGLDSTRGLRLSGRQHGCGFLLLLWVHLSTGSRKRALRDAGGGGGEGSGSQRTVSRREWGCGPAGSQSPDVGVGVWISCLFAQELVENRQIVGVS